MGVPSVYVSRSSLIKIRNFFFLLISIRQNQGNILSDDDLKEWQITICLGVFQVSS